MAEIIVLDPTAESPGRTQLDITAYIDADGVDWGDAAITAAMADSALGSLPVDYRVPNRTVSIPLILKAIGATTFDTIRQQIQAKAALFQREGGWLSRQTSIGTVYVTVVSATLKLGGDWFQANRSFDTSAVLTLECLPDWYGAEITLDDIVETTNPEIATTLKLSAVNAAIKGDYPGRVRLVVDNDVAAISQLGLLWAFRSRNYSSASTARLVYEAETLTPKDTAALATITGASGVTNNVIRHTSLSTSWTPVLSTQILSGSAHMTHTGTYRVRARVYSTSAAATVKVRLVYDVGDLVIPEENDSWMIPGASNFYIADLGEVRLDQALQGTHRWMGLIQAQGTSGGENVSIDTVWLQPLDECAGVLRAQATAVEGLATFTARDEFNQTAGALAGKTLPVGGTWAAGGGSATDFQVDATNHNVTRTTAVTETFPGGGKIALAGTTSMTDTTLAVWLSRSTHYVSPGPAMYFGFVARYVDASNYALGVVRNSVGSIYGDDRVTLAVYKVIAGAATQITSKDIATWNPNSTLRFVIGQDGAFTLSLDWLSTTMSGSDTALATGGTLAAGRVGMYDVYASALAMTRTFDSFTASTVARDAVMYGSQSAEVRWDGNVREDTAGVAWGPVSSVTGDLARVPPSGLEGRPVELFVKASRGDLNNVADSGIDDISARVFYRPSWLITPGT